MAKYSKQDVEIARKALLDFLKPGDTIFTVLRHVSRSGMQRRIDLYRHTKDGPACISYYAACVMGDRLSDKGGIVADGCGMDMGFNLVYNLGRTLWPEGFDLPEGKRGRNGDKSGHDNDGGYALEQRWL